MKAMSALRYLSRVFLTVALLIIVATPALQGTQIKSSAPAANSTLIVKAPPQTVIWVNSLRYGPVPESGELNIKNLRAGGQTVRARLKGKHEITQTVSLASDSQESVEISLTTPADNAELSFQTAEELRESGKHTEAIKEYRNAIRLRLQSRKSGYPAARICLARSLLANEQYDKAIAEIRQVLQESPGPNPEAYTVLGNIKRTQGLHEEALANYEKALAQTRNFSPEAHTGMAIAYQDRNRPEEAIKHYRKAIAQANDTEPILYFLVGTALEREYRLKEAIEAYEKYLELEPNSRQASAVRSIIKQLKREAKWN